MPIAQALLPEFDHEMATTRRLLERVPEDRASWTPHPKSTPLGGLAAHIATLAGMAVNVLGRTEVDINPPGGPSFTPPPFTSTADLLATFDERVQQSRAAIAAATDDDLRVEWSLKNGGRTIFTLPRVAALRTMMMSHIIHHRGQLSVYLRLNDVPLPSIYGPTADTPM
ncbi:MAG TPA: DinB family protein [Longimicrobiaceae bacterium]|nr:DinB family protein [Longimicrobiaceae bacterium]